MNDNLFLHLRGFTDCGSNIAVDTPDGRSFRYDELAALSGRCANALVAAGLEPGGRVAAQIEKSVEALVLYLGVIRAGGVFLPLNTSYTTAEIGYFLEDAQPTIFVCDPDRVKPLSEVVGRTGAKLLTVDAAGSGSLADAIGVQSEDFQTVERSGDDLAAILYTSGTTGRSKGAMLTHRNLSSNAETLVASWDFTSGDRLIHALPIFHTHGLFVAINVTLTSGASMIFLPGFSADEIFRFLPDATTLMGVPTFYTRLLNDGRLNRESTAHMRLFVSGSAPLLADTHREWTERTGHAILERYGMTETNMNTSNPYGAQRIAGTVGIPLPGVALRITDMESGATLENEQVGMIEVKGPNVFKGYWRMPEKTAAEFRSDGYFITGDVGKIDANGYVSIVGRSKDLIISGGYNVYPKEVESEIDDLEGVVESAVIGLPHPDLGEGVTAILVVRPDAKLTEEIVRRQLATRLARYKLPKHVSFAESLPRNAMGKVQKNVLRDQLAGLYMKKVSA